MRRTSAPALLLLQLIACGGGRMSDEGVTNARDGPRSSAPIRVGAPMPDFSVLFLDDPSVTPSRDRLRGRYYLLEVWATWCPGCVRDMPGLDRIYRAHGGLNFTILSLSIDDDPRDIAAFRKHRWPMPWLHARLGAHHPLLEALAIDAVPTYVLVDEDGTVVAANEGETLLELEGVARHLEARRHRTLPDP